VIRNPDYFFSCDLHSVIRTIFSMIRSASDQFISFSDDDNIADQGLFLQITDHFCGSRIIFADHGSFLRIVDCLM